MQRRCHNRESCFRRITINKRKTSSSSTDYDDKDESDSSESIESCATRFNGTSKARLTAATCKFEQLSESPMLGCMGR